MQLKTTLVLKNLMDSAEITAIFYNVKEIKIKKYVACFLICKSHHLCAEVREFSEHFIKAYCILRDL